MKNIKEFNVMDFARPTTKVERISPINNQFVQMVEITVKKTGSAEADFWSCLAALGGENVGDKYQFVSLAGVILDNQGKPEFSLASSTKAFWWEVLEDFSGAIGVVFWVHEYSTMTKIMVNIVRK